MKILVLLTIAALLSGCIVAGRIDSVNANSQALTSRSAAQNTDGSDNNSEAVRDMEGGGAVAPETTIPVQ